MFGVWHVFLWMRASYEVFVAVLCSSFGAPQSTADEVVFADSCMEWQSPSAVAWIFFRCDLKSQITFAGP